MMRMTYRAVLFDLDGTLLDSLQDLASSCNRALQRHGYPTHPVDPYRYFVGDGVEMLVRRAMPASAVSDERVAELLRDFRADYLERWTENTRPYPGVPELLDALAERGLRLCVLSNKSDDLTRLFVARLLPRERFEVVLGATAELPKKPAPEAPLHIAARMSVPPSEFLYLGDTATDMRTAVAAGMYPVGVLWGFRTAEELRDAGARVLIDRPADLLALL